MFCSSNPGIAKRHVHEKQSTPRHAGISAPPRRGGWICDKHEAFLDCLILRTKKFGDFGFRIKQKRYL